MVFSLVNNLPKPDGLLRFEELNQGMLPETPGVYVWYDYLGTSLYVGKAANLKRRIESHLYESHNQYLKKDISRNRISHIIYFECETEEDAVILERVLIKNSSFVGVYNIQMITDKDTVVKKRYADFKKKSRSDKKKDVKIPITDDMYKQILIVSRKEGFTPTQFSTRTFSETLLNKSEFPDVEYDSGTGTFIHVKLNLEIYNMLVELSVAWRCSIRKAAHKIFDYALKNDNYVKEYGHLIQG